MALFAPATWAVSPEETQEVSRDGDWLQVGIPVLGFGLTFLLEEHDRPSSWRGADAVLDPLRFEGSPRHDFVAAALRTELMTYSLKAGIDEKRPNGGAHSFPSGHTSTAFMGAEFIRNEYGWWWGTPAYLAASFVGWTRVASDNHWNHDVLAGAAIGILGNHDVAEFPVASGLLTIRPTLLFTQTDPRGAIGEAADAPRTGTGVLLTYDFGSR